MSIGKKNKIKIAIDITLYKCYTIGTVKQRRD